MGAEKKKTILLVEDEAIIAMTEKKILEKFGYHVIVAGTGEEAIATVEKSPGIDLILMDINLGSGIDGTEAAAIILKQRDLPVVFLSSHTEPEVVEKTEKITSYGYVVKNSSSTVLDASIKMAFKLFAARRREIEKEEALWKSERDLLEAQKIAHIGNWTYDPATQQPDWSEEMFRIWGLDPKLGAPAYAEHKKLIHPEDFQRFDIAVHEAVEHGTPYQLELRICCPDGVEKTIVTICEPQLDRAGRVVSLKGTIQDISKRKQAEDAVSQAKKDWEECFDSITDMITIHDSDFNIIRANKAGRSLLQLPELAEHLQLKCFSFYHGAAAPPDGCPSCACLKTGTPGVFELFEPHLNRYLEIRAIPRFDRNNQRAGLIHIVRDITERKQEESKKEAALAALQENEERYRAIFDSSPDAILLTAPDGRIIAVNSATCRLFQQTEEEIIGGGRNGLLDASDPRLAAALEERERTGKFEGELTFIRKKGERFSGEISSVVFKDKDGNARTSMIIRDIGERKHSEQTLRQSEERLRDIIFSMADWVWEVDEKGVYTYSSEKGEALLGYSQTEIIGKTPFDFMPAAEAKRVGAIFSEIAAKKLPIKDLENWNIGKNGESICLLTSGVPILDKKGNFKGYRGVDKDITERKRAEEALLDAQTRYRLLFEHAPDGIVVIDPGTTRILEFNETAHKQLGYSREEFSRLSIPDIDADETQEETHSHIARVMDEGLNTFETRQRTRQGEIRNILVTAQFTRIGGRPIYHCIWRDITERKRAEEEKEQIISLQKATIESTADGILVIDHTGKITDFNRRFASMWRIPDSVLAARDDAQALHFVLDQLLDPQSFLAKVNELYAAPEQESFDQLLLKDGRFFERYSRPQLISGRPLGRVWSFRDISERRQVEEALRQSEERFRTLYENSPLGLYRTTPDGRIQMANPALIRMLGYSSFADLAKLDLEQNGFTPSHPRARFIENIEKHGAVKGLEYSWKRLDGALLIVRESARAIRDAQGKTLFYDGIVEDITESKQAEKLPEALYKISQAVYDADNLNELFKHVHRALADIIPTDNLFIALLSDDGKTMNFPYFIDEKNPNDTASIQADNLQSLTVEVLATKRSLLLDEAELLDRYASGRNKVWGSAPKCWLGVPLMIRDTIIGVMAVQDYHKAGVYVDKDVKLLESTAGQIAVAIERKRAAEALRESVDSFKGYFNMGTVGMCVTSLKTGWIEVNDCLCRMLGYSREELLHLTWAEMTHPDDLNSDLDLFNQVLAGERDSYELEKRFIRKDGQVIYTRLYATCQRNLDGTVHHLLASLVDISERKRAEEGIQNTLRFQQAMMDAVPSPIFYKDANCIYIGGNKAFEQFIGLAQEQFIGRTVYDISPADLAEKYDRADRELLNNKGIQTYEASVVYADGTRHAVIFNKALFTDAEGMVAGLIGVILDISERKQAEILEQAVFEIARAADKAASLDDLYRSVHLIIKGLMPAENILIARYDEKENLVSFPYFVDEKDPVPKPRKSSRGLTDYVLRTGRTLLSDAALEKELERSGEAKRRGSPSACWLGVPLKAGNKTIGVIALDNYSDPKAYGEREKKILEYVSSQIANAIERKQAEEEIKRQLAEKETLLKEVHHRIKNNIASIAGLISLRLQSVINPEAAAVLKEAAGRVDSMRILYDKLLLSEDYADISVKNYLETLIDTIAAIFPDDVEIRVEKRIADFHLDSKKLFPLGIIINELLTNKMKYAFSGRKRGSIRIDLALAENRVKLTIADDGNPLPPGFDVKEAKGFGLMLVKMLSQQLGGSFAIENHKGVRCTVEFNI